MSEDIIDKKDSSPLEQVRAYGLQSSLPFHLSFEEVVKDDGTKAIKWDAKYETSLAGQVAVFGYMIDMLGNVHDQMRVRFAEQEARLAKIKVKDKRAKAIKREYTHTEINTVVAMRNWLLKIMDEMLPLIYAEAKENDVKNIKVVSPQAAMHEIEQAKVLSSLKIVPR